MVTRCYTSMVGERPLFFAYFVRAQHFVVNDAKDSAPVAARLNVTEGEMAQSSSGHYTRITVLLLLPLSYLGAHSGADQPLLCALPACHGQPACLPSKGFSLFCVSPPSKVSVDPTGCMLRSGFGLRACDIQSPWLP